MFPHHPAYSSSKWLILGVTELDYLLKTGKKQISDSTDLPVVFIILYI